MDSLILLGMILGFIRFVLPKIILWGLEAFTVDTVESWDVHES